MSCVLWKQCRLVNIVSIFQTLPMQGFFVSKQVDEV